MKSIRFNQTTRVALWDGPRSRVVARTLLWSLAVAVAAGGCGRPAAIPAGSNILLVTIDTLRADHLSSYGYGRETSPVIDRLAAEGVRFDQAAVQWPKTGPSFASMFTATYPKNNGIVRKIGIPLPDDFLMLAEVLAARGYGTYAVVSNGAVSQELNFHQGFDVYLETWKGREDWPLEDRDRGNVVTELTRQAVAEIDRDKPFFLWVHYLDPHFPYTPPGEWSDRFQGDEFFDPEIELPIRWDKHRTVVGAVGSSQVLEERTDLDFYVARYDAEISYVDHELGEILSFLEGEGLLDDTLTVLTSDHGESLGDHGYYFDHGRLAFQTCLRVPLIFHYPGVLTPDVDPDPVELIGLMPTLLEAAGTELPEGRWMQGRSFLGRLFGERLPADKPALAFSEAGYGGPGRWQRVVRSRRFKLVQAFEGGAQRWITGGIGNEFALYDLGEDPEETRIVLAEHEREVERLRRVLTRWYETPFDALAAASGEQQLDTLDEATLEQLKALGYIE